MTTEQTSDIEIVKNLVKRFKHCVTHAGSDQEFAWSTVVHEVAAIERLEQAIATLTARCEQTAQQLKDQNNDYLESVQTLSLRLEQAEQERDAFEDVIASNALTFTEGIANGIAQARAELLAQVRKIAYEIFGEWQQDHDHRVGKLLEALAGKCPGYRADIDALAPPQE